MPFEYYPIQGDEIRLLSVEPVSDDGICPTSPIRCSIEHASLPTEQPTRREQACNNVSYVWPELSSNCDFTSIFKKQHVASFEDLVANDAERVYTLAGSNTVTRNQSYFVWGDYIALSYLWGSPTPVHTIMLNGAEFEVGPNLFLALDQLRRTTRVRDGFKIWIDAICIDQSNVLERAQQVARMRFIYASAWQVFIWLGSGRDDASLAITMIRCLAAWRRCRKSVDHLYRRTRAINAKPLFIYYGEDKSLLDTKARQALYPLLTSPYWGRMWIIQEIALARHDSPVYYGGSCVAFSDLCDAARVIAEDEARLGRDIMALQRPRSYLGSRSSEIARDRIADERPWSSERTWDLLLSLKQLQDDQTGHTAVRDILHPLRLSLEANLTNEKDRVYGMLGIKALAERVNIFPDYAAKLEDIYIHLSARLLESGEMNLLRLAFSRQDIYLDQWKLEELPAFWRRRHLAAIIGPTVHFVMKTIGHTVHQKQCCCHKVPSWVVCFSCKSVPRLFCQGLFRAGGGLASPQSPIRPEPGVLRIRALVCDALDSLSTCHSAEPAGEFPAIGSAGIDSSYGSYETTRAALWRTLVWDSTADGSKAPQAYSWLLNGRIWRNRHGDAVSGVYAHGFGLNNVMQQNYRLRLCGYTFEQLVFGENSSLLKFRLTTASRIYEMTSEQRQCLSWATNVKAWRRLVGTKGGRIGLTTGAARKGDCIAVIVGCDVPMVLRAVTPGRYTVVGECYVDGIMYGELLETASADYIELV